MKILSMYVFRLSALRRLVPIIFLFLSTQVNALTDEDAANVTITELHDALMQIMQNADELGYAGRVKLMETIVTNHFDSARIAQVVLSRHWLTMDKMEQDNFVDLFQRLSIATYASRFSGYSGESFQINSTEAAKRGRLLVRTELLRPGKDSVKLDYLLHQKDGEWRIINVIANGVSDLSLKRGEYASVLKENGYNTLLDEIRAKIRTMEGDTSVTTDPAE